MREGAKKYRQNPEHSIKLTIKLKTKTHGSVSV